jgi:uncharacterized alpha-E superfamily protein
MLARVAENLYWMSRYLERAENTVRLLRVHGNLLMDLPGIDDHRGWISLVSVNGLDEAFQQQYGQANETNVSHFLLADKNNAGSLLNAFYNVQVNLRSSRDILPKLIYESMNSLCRSVAKHIGEASNDTAQRLSFLRNVEERLQAIAGGLNSNMNHDLGYMFMRMGCYIERADMTSRIIDVQSTRLTPQESNNEAIAITAQRWIAVLRSLVANQMYRQSLKTTVNGPDTLRFLLTNRTLPRSYTFCLDHLDECLQTLEMNASSRKAVLKLQEVLRQADYTALASDPTLLHVFLDELQLGMLKVASEISSTYFPPLPLEADPDQQPPTQEAVQNTE